MTSVHDKPLRVSGEKTKISPNQTLLQLIQREVARFQSQVNYLNKLDVYSTFTTISASIINSSGGIATVSYPSVYTASIPTTLPSGSTLDATNEKDFIVFINGQYMEYDTFTIQQSGSAFVITINTGSLGYEIVSDDEIVAWGKFD